MSNNEKLLAMAVERYPILYNKSLKEFRDRTKTGLIWKKIADDLNLKSGSEASKQFRNLRKRYTKVKKEFNDVYKSGTGTEDCSKQKKAVEKLDFLRWLDTFIQQRKAKNNLSESDEEEDGEDEAGDEDEEQNESDGNQTTPQTAATSASITPEVEDPDDLQASETPVVPPSKKKKFSRKKLSAVTGLPKWHSKTEEVELSLLQNISKGLENEEKKKERDECDLFGELISSKLRRLSQENREEAEMAINNVIHSFVIKERLSSAPPTMQPASFPPGWQALPASTMSMMGLPPMPGIGAASGIGMSAMSGVGASSREALSHGSQWSSQRPYNVPSTSYVSQLEHEEGPPSYDNLSV